VEVNLVCGGSKFGLWWTWILFLVEVDLVCCRSGFVLWWKWIWFVVEVDLICGGSGFATTQENSLRLEVLREWNVALQKIVEHFSFDVHMSVHHKYFSKVQPKRSNVFSIYLFL